jgi:hypothetical protein
MHDVVAAVLAGRLLEEDRGEAGGNFRRGFRVARQPDEVP